MTPTPNTEQQPQEQETTEQRYQRLYSQQTQHQQELLQSVQSLRDEMANLKQPPPQQEPEQQLTPAGKAEWVEKIRQGDFEGAQRTIVEEVQRSLKPNLDQLRQEAYQQAVSATQINLEMDRYLNKIRTDNPDIVQFERYLSAPVSQRVENAKASGRIKSGDDLVREYKAAVDAEVAELRNLGLQFRAAGKSEALSRSREVISSTPLQPQQVQSGQPTQVQDAQPETTEDYFTRRRADEARRRGMSL